ncbi:hypothetical protein AVEN_71840-1 [Araneus ventricosus]|uniref:Peptidase A2 domain-containing protein n=1 Tax=Araneus ventricosus TaxID=182803 RepID=A0A4Y2J9C3_ARAVE|nr:hypothetical protein AVEN_71840-1 [Araneus ventricosus]
MSTPNEKFREVEMKTKLKLVNLEKIVPKQKLSANGVEIVKYIQKNSVQLKMPYVTFVKRKVIIPGYADRISSSYLGDLKNSSSEDKWKVNVLVDNKLLHFKIDTGADLTVISQKIFQSVWGNKKKLQASN